MNGNSEMINAMLRYGASWALCPSCDHETPVYPSSLFGSSDASSCQFCPASLQLLEGQAVISECHRLDQDDAIEFESRKINWDMGIAAGLQMWPELNPYNQNIATSQPKKRGSSLFRRLFRKR